MKKRELNLDPTDAVIMALGYMLELLHRFGNKNGVPPKALAMKMWPHSTSWIHNRKPGVIYRQEGKGATYAATNMCIRMVRMGLAEPSPKGYRLTSKGQLEAIDAHKIAADKAARRAAREARKHD